MWPPSSSLVKEGRSLPSCSKRLPRTDTLSVQCDSERLRAFTGRQRHFHSSASIRMSLLIKVQSLLSSPYICPLGPIITLICLYLLALSLDIKGEPDYGLFHLVSTLFYRRCASRSLSTL